MTRYIKQGLLDRNCLQRPTQPAGFLSHPGDLIRHRVNAVLLHTHGVFQGVMPAPVVAPLPGEQGVEFIANLTVRITTAPSWQR